MATQLEMAEQQLYGWNCAHAGERIEAMVGGMGLTMAEWKKLVNDGSVEYLPDYIKDEITDYLLGK